MKGNRHVVLLGGLGATGPAMLAKLLKIAVVMGAGLLLTLTAGKALVETVVNSQFPEALAVKVEALPLLFPLHMFTGGMALVLVAITILLRGTRWHRMAGRIAAADILVAGVTAIPVALESPVTRVSAAGFTTQAVVWLALLVAGIYFVRKRRIAQHQAAMLMMAAVTSGAMFFRIWLALWSMVGFRSHFWTFYAIDAWIAWTLPLAVAIWFVARRAGKARISKARLVKHLADWNRWKLTTPRR